MKNKNESYIKTIPLFFNTYLLNILFTTKIPIIIYLQSKTTIYILLIIN